MCWRWDTLVEGVEHLGGSGVLVGDFLEDFTYFYTALCWSKSREIIMSVFAIVLLLGDINVLEW